MFWGGERKVLTVLFADIRNFTTITEHLPPEILTKLVNDYFTEMTEIVFDNEGLLDKYMGDALMAVFGAPVDNPRHPLLACNAAVQIEQKVDELNKSGILPEKISVGVGITTGEMIVGNMGSRDIFDYTVIGDTVNLGARIEKLNKIYRTSILINSQTHERAAGNIVCRDLDLIRVRGRAAPEKIFELLGIKGEVDKKTLDLVNLWREGLSQYRACHWERAEQIFTRVVQQYPNDYPAQLYQKRCQQFRKVPPPKDWDGVFSLAV
ncbi:adenylate/guanylate cyclase domain-containing protein [Bdellovibrionota bacterium]